MDRFAVLRTFADFNSYLSHSLDLSIRAQYISSSDGVPSSTGIDGNGDLYVYAVVDTGILQGLSEYVHPYHFIEGAVNIAHEMHHAAVISRSDILGDDKIPLFESYVSHCYNTSVYRNEYDKFSFEIAAESFALHAVREHLAGVMDPAMLDRQLLEYVNSKATLKSGAYPYFAHSDRGFDNMKQVFDAFDKAYETSFVDKKDFTTKPANGEAACVRDALKADGKLRRGFKNAPDGRAQAGCASCIVISTHPGDSEWHDLAESEDYSLSRVREFRDERFDFFFDKSDDLDSGSNPDLGPDRDNNGSPPRP